jgi:hypothetical protein
MLLVSPVVENQAVMDDYVNPFSVAWTDNFT